MSDPVAAPEPQAEAAEPVLVDPISTAAVDPNPAPVPPTIAEAQPESDQSDESASVVPSEPQSGADVANQTVTGKAAKGLPDPADSAPVIAALAEIIDPDAPAANVDDLDVNGRRKRNPNSDQVHNIVGPAATTAASRMV